MQVDRAVLQRQYVLLDRAFHLAQHVRAFVNSLINWQAIPFRVLRALQLKIWCELNVGAFDDPIEPPSAEVKWGYKPSS